MRLRVFQSSIWYFSIFLLFGAHRAAQAQTTATGASSAASPTDPGPRSGAANAGGPLAGLGSDLTTFFTNALARFQEVDSVTGSIAGEAGFGLGPTFNANSCASCHAQPAVGGSSPHPTLGQIKEVNPQIAFATLDRIAGKSQTVPSFITADGPVREARFIQNPDGSLDGGVHGLYTIAGRIDAPPACAQAQPNFAQALRQGNVIFRIPTPTFGLGLVESTPDATLTANLGATANARASLGIGGRFNTSGNDGTITRFGWKAQNKSLLIFAGEAYNVEQGVTNEIFPNERGSGACVGNPTPEDRTNIRNPNNNTLVGDASTMSSDTVNFAAFMRLSAAPAPTTHTTSELRGQQTFNSIGCNLCHTTTLTSGPSGFPNQSNVQFHPYSDFAIHHMGPDNADFINQGGAGFDEFRSAPLWGVGQRIFFLHDGRSGPKNGGLLNAVLAHFSVDNSDPDCAYGAEFRSDGVACVGEASYVIENFVSLSNSQQQDLLNFLRSL
jgi:CxxC motif-containing protein (DUF1111 family)